MNVTVHSPGRASRAARRALTALIGAALVVTTVGAPAHATDKDGVAPAVAPPIPDVELQIHSRLQHLLNPVLTTVAGDTQLRTLVRHAVARQFDGDTNALWSTVIQEAEQGGYINPGAADWLTFKNAVEQFEYINGYAYDPQVYIPNYGEGLPLSSVITVAVAPADENATSTQGYRVDAYGNVTPLATPIDETYAETNEVWVLSVNERVVTTPPARTSAPEVGAAAGTPSAQGPSAAAAIAPQAVCNPTGLRNNQGEEYLQRWRVPNKNSFGGLFEGRREMRLIVVTTTGAKIKDYYFPKVKRKNVDQWQNSDVFITTWDRAVYGDVMAYQWFELDGGRTVSSTISVPIPGGGTISTNVTKQERDDEGGGTAVVFSESTYREYDTGLIRFQVCSQGGDGGTGGGNFACGAIASASSTYPGYSPSRATDCNRSTALGPSYSWANNAGTWPPSRPEWVQADFGVNKTIRRVVVYTSQGYPIRDFDVQVWNGVSFLTVASVNGNTSLTVTVTFAAATTRLIRISGRSGPDRQQSYVRVNELEAYAV